MNWRMLCTILVIGVLSSAASGEVPRLISYQGFLMESPTGPPLQGQYDIVFAIYAASSGGTALWTESHAAVPVNRGVFSVNLGSLQPLSNSLFADGERWLNVNVPNIAIGLPRTRITSGVWAMRASIADTALAFSGAVPSHAHSLDDLADVHAPAPSPGEALAWNGSNWAPARAFGYPVNPSAENGIAATWFDQWDGGADYVRVVTILGTDGSMWTRGIYEYSGAWVSAGNIPVPVSEVSYWNPGMFVTHDGRFFGHASSGPAWVQVVAPPCATKVVPR